MHPFQSGAYLRSPRHEFCSYSKYSCLITYVNTPEFADVLEDEGLLLVFSRSRPFFFWEKQQRQTTKTAKTATPTTPPAATAIIIKVFSDRAWELGGNIVEESICCVSIGDGDGLGLGETQLLWIVGEAELWRSGEAEL
mmetsp:Transcript_1543/g.2318  ORF Transcript_1543/g.2318 Transcript_1543/m.2318 type:complete len:139 (-) Transcript_1543:195-611(-)